MLHTLSAILVILILTGGEAFSDSKNSTAKKREKVDLGTRDFSNESQFTGDVAFSVPLAAKGGLDVNLRYNSNLHKLIPAENQFSPPGWVGVGWSLSLPSIQADMNNTRDPADDKYFFVGADFTSELIVDSANVFMLREYRHWKIVRHLASGNVVGWTITLENGTIQRFGNYDDSTASFVLDSLPTHATRFFIAWGNLFSTTSPGGSPSLVAYQWDLSDIQDVNGDHTTITYRQFKESLAGTSLLYTRESYPKEIIDRAGRKVVFVLYDNPLLNLDPGLVGYGQTKTDTRTLKRFLVQDKLGGTISGCEFQYDTINVLDRASTSNKKTFLSKLIDLDAKLNAAKTTTFEYSGVSTPLDTGDHNPGALKRITLPEGGTVEYKYAKGVVVTSRAPQVGAMGDYWSSYGGGRLASNSEYWSLSGTDFFVVRAGAHIEAYRWTAKNEFEVDNTFPLASLSFEPASSGYWVQNNYVVLKTGNQLLVAKRFGDGWNKDTIESNTNIQTLQVLGLGSDYFLYATNCNPGYPSNPQSGDVKIATYSNSGAWSVQSMGNYYIGSGFQILCGTRACGGSGGLFPIWVYNPANLTWETTSTPVTLHAVGPDYFVQKGQLQSQFYVYKWNGSSWVYSDVTGNPQPWVENASILTGNNFFLIYGSSGTAYIATNTSTGWYATDLLSLLPDAVPSSRWRFAVGPDFVAVTWRHTATDTWKVGVVKFRNGQWQTGSIVCSLQAIPRVDPWIDASDAEQCTPTVSGSTIFVEVYSSNQHLRLSALVFRNAGWDVQPFLEFTANQMNPTRNPLKPFVQPGHDFTVCVLDTSIYCDSSEEILVWKRTYGDQFREVYADAIPAGYDYAVSTKRVNDRHGNVKETTYQFEKGAYDDAINTVKYNKSTELHPANTGKTVTYFFNDLGPLDAEFPPDAPDYKWLDGMPYLTRSTNSDYQEVSRTSNTWTVTFPGSTLGVEMLSPIETTESGCWQTVPAGAAIHTVLDDGATLDPSDYAYTTVDCYDILQVRLQAASGRPAPNTNISVTADIKSHVWSDSARFWLVLLQGDGFSQQCVKDTICTAPRYGGSFEPYTLTVPSSWVTDVSRLYVNVEPGSGFLEVARIKCDLQYRIDRGTYYARLTETSTLRDAVTVAQSNEYFDTNGLIRRTTETNSEGTQRVTETKYAFERPSYADMSSSKHMISQVYSATVKKGGSDVEAKKWTLWGNGDGIWRPREEWAWKGDGSTNDQTAPEDPDGSNEAMKSLAYEYYDVHGNLLQSRDANDVPTAITWGFDTLVSTAIVRNATKDQVAISVFDDGDVSSWNAGSGAWTLENGLYRQTDGVSTAPWDDPRRNTSISIDDAALEADIRFDNAGSCRYAAIMKYVSTWNFIRFELRKQESLVMISAHSGANVVNASTSFTFNENQWYHLKGEIQGSVARLYVDGKLLKTLEHAYVNQAQGMIGLCTYATVASFDNVRFYPVTAMAASSSYDPVTLLQTQSHDESGVLTRFTYDLLGRKTARHIRSGGKLNLASEYRYQYSRFVADVYDSTRPNTVEMIFPEAASGCSDFSAGTGWSSSGDVTFNVPYAGETTVRMGKDAGDWSQLAKTIPTGHILVRVDFYPDDGTGGTPNVLGFAGDYDLYVIYDPNEDRFKVQIDSGNGLEYPLTFSLDSPPNQWYTVEIEKTETDAAYAFVFPRGQGRIYATGYMYYTPAFPSGANAVISRSNDDYYYLANHYVGLPERQTVFFDGLGRPIQEQHQLKTSSIVSATTYDQAGRTSRIYKPFEKDFGGQNRHRYDTSFAADADAYYNAMDLAESHTDGYPYNEFQYFQDPLDRLQRQSAPGTGWRMGTGRELKFSHLANAYNEVPGYYGDLLFKTRRMDEDSIRADTFIDKFGNTVASVVDSGGLGLCTKMNYDIVGDKTASITPRGDTTQYSYTPLKQLRQKTSPDEGTVQYLYDRNGNVRLVKDAAHAGTAPNNVDIEDDCITPPTILSGQFSLGMPGKVNLLALVGDLEDDSRLFIRIKANGVTLITVATYWWYSGSGSVILPKGTYTYEVEVTGEYAAFEYYITCQTGYEFIYYKYDSFNRVLEVGEYESNSTSANFTQAHAETSSFPTANKLLTASYAYDLASTDSLASGQRNLKGKVSVATSYRSGQWELMTSYSYDDFGNVEWLLHRNSAERSWTIRYDRDLQGRVTKKHFLDWYSSSYNLYAFCTYDQMGRLLYVYTGRFADARFKTQEGLYTYYASDLPKRLQLANVQGVDYRYNSRDWLKQINHQNLNSGDDPGHDGAQGSPIPVDMFGMVLGYNGLTDIGGAQVGRARWNGDISWLMYNMANVTTDSTSLVGNTYFYDNSNRITKSDFGYYYGGWQPTTKYDESNYQYDANGNILGLRRWGYNGSQMDSLTYVYSTGKNRLRHIQDAVSPSAFTVDIDNQVTDNYGYDDNGALQKDLQRDIAFVVSDIRGLPVSMWKASTGAEVKYFYDTEGKRIRKDASVTEYYLNDPSGNTEAIVKSDLSTATHSTWGNDNIGQVKRTGTSWARYYYLKDHLGTIKMTVDASCNRASWDDFYPFGMQMEQRCGNQGQGDARYKFTQKSRDVESPYDCFDHHQVSCSKVSGAWSCCRTSDVVSTPT
jgi:YD repeat-containing protein